MGGIGVRSVGSGFGAWFFCDVSVWWASGGRGIFGFSFGWRVFGLCFVFVVFYVFFGRVFCFSRFSRVLGVSFIRFGFVIRFRGGGWAGRGVGMK